MQLRLRTQALPLLLLLSLPLLPTPLWASGRAKPHTVGIGAGKRVPYSIVSDPSGAAPDEKTLHVRPLIVDDKVKDWTTGEVHDITDRSFVVRRALRLNDSLPGDKTEHWIWQRGPWIMIDRTNGHVTAMKLPDYDPAVSQVIWFRDYAAYCGLTSGGHQLYAVVAQVAARRPILAKKIGPWTPTPPVSGPPAAPCLRQSRLAARSPPRQLQPHRRRRAHELQPRRAIGSPGGRRRHRREQQWKCRLR